MKAWILAAGIGLAFLPGIANAGATPEARDCQTGSARRGACIQSSGQPGAPQVSVSRQTVQPRPAQTAHNDAARRRSGKHVPDAELIGPRGAL